MPRTKNTSPVKVDSDLKERLTELLGEREYAKLIRTCIAGIPTYITINLQKTSMTALRKALKQYSITVEPLANFPDSAKVKGNLKQLGVTMEYLSGDYFIQDLASVITVLSLSVEPGQSVLDCCAAPGSKTTYMAQLMRNKGLIVANDKNKHRITSLLANLSRMGATNVIITNEDFKNPKVTKTIPLRFDRVLVDAPCTGEGLIAKNVSRLARNSSKDLEPMSLTQQALLNQALNFLKPGGILVYSTCSTAIQENELVVKQVLEKHPEVYLELPPVVEQNKVKTHVPAPLQQLFPDISNLTLRLYPHVHQTLGFFIARFRKRVKNN